jgi:hypothetical protein
MTISKKSVRPYNEEACIQSHKAVLDAIRDLTRKHPKDTQIILHGALHAVFSEILVESPSGMHTVSFILNQITNMMDEAIVTSEQELQDELLDEALDDDEETMH